MHNNRTTFRHGERMLSDGDRQSWQFSCQASVTFSNHIREFYEDRQVWFYPRGHGANFVVFRDINRCFLERSLHQEIERYSLATSPNVGPQAIRDTETGGMDYTVGPPTPYPPMWAKGPDPLIVPEVIIQLASETIHTRKAWEVSVIEYAKAICGQNGIAWRPEWEALLATTNTKVEVNKKIFTELVLQSQEVAGIPEALIRHINQSSGMGRIKAKLDVFMVSQNECTNNITRYSVEVENHRKRLAEIRSQINIMFNVSEEDLLMQETAKVLADGFWKFVCLSGTDVVFETTNPVVIKHRNAANGTDLEVNFGKMRAFVDLANGRIRVPRGPDQTDDTLANGFWHPHINTNNSICWGNAGGAADKFAKEAKLAEAMSTLWLLLCTYNDGSPYIGLHEFYIVRHPEALLKETKELQKWATQRLDKEWLEEHAPETMEVLERGSDTFYVRVWRNKILKFNIWERNKYYIAGVRGGNPVEIPEKFWKHF